MSGILLAFGLLAAALEVRAATPTYDEPRIELHGEIHGVAGNLATFSRAIGEALADAGEVVAAFELPADGQAVFDGWWADHARPFTSEEIAAMGWCELSDGRTSSELLDTMAGLKEMGRGGGLTIRLIDTRFSRPPLHSVRDTSSRGSAELAIALARAAADHPDARVLALIGNVHARKTPITMPEALGGGQMLTAGHLLSREVVSVAYLYDDGGRYGCDLNGCGVSTLVSNQANLERAGEAYDRIVRVGPASPTTPLSESGHCAG